MLKYKRANLIRAGIIGIVVCVLIVAIGLQPERLLAMATTAQYRAMFVDASGLTVGNKVRISGVDVGTVTEVGLQGLTAEVSFTVERRLTLGTDTKAQIATGTLLGERVLRIEPAGPGKMPPQAVIPTARSSSPYSLTQAVDELTTNTAGTDTASLNSSLDALSATLDRIAPQLGPTMDGLIRVSKTVNERDDTLGELLKSASAVTSVLSERSDRINSLILNANDLVGVLAERRQAIADLLANTSAVASALTGIVSDNREKLGPALDQLNSVLAMLERNRATIDETLPRLSKYMITLGETVSSGHYYMAFVPNLSLGSMTQPFIDALFHLQPRAKFPIPRNGIPGAPR